MKIKYFLSFCFLIILTSVVYCAPIHPHLSWNGLNASSTTIVVLWETSANTSSQVRYGTSPGVYTNTITKSPTYKGAVGRYVHTVRIDNLTPDAQYYYQCGNATDGWSSEKIFRTGPSIGSTKNFRFVAAGDPRNNDANNPPSNYNDIVTIKNLIKGSNPMFLVFSGDLVNSGQTQSEWDNAFFRAYDDLISSAPFFSAEGNHENTYLNSCYYDQFEWPKNNGGDEQWYSFNYGNAHYVFLQLIDGSKDIAVGSSQYNWLLSDLQTADSNPNIKWKFVTFHAPPYCDASGHTRNTNILTTICPLFDQYKVDMVFNGHNHLYERSKKMRNRVAPPDQIMESGPNFSSTIEGVVYVTVGRAGASGHSPVSPLREWTASSNTAFHYAVIDIDNTQGKLFMKVYNNSNTLIDQCTITKPAPVNPNVYYVDPAGSDTTGTGSISSPWRTLAYAVSRPLSQGVTVHLNAGTFNETQASVVPVGINIEGAGASNTIIRSTIADTLIKLQSGSITNGNQVLSNFKIDGQSRQLDHGIEVSNRRNVTLRDLSFSEIDDKAMLVYGSDYITGIKIFNISIVNCSRDNIDWSDGCLDIGHLQGAEIYNVTINENRGYGIKFYNNGYFKGLKIHDCNITVPTVDPLWGADICIELWNVYDDCEIYNMTVNTWFSIVVGNKGVGQYSMYIHDNRMVYPALHTKEAIEAGASDMIISNNYIENAGTAIGIFGDTASTGRSNITINNNIIYETNYSLVEIHMETGNLSNLKIYNNVVHKNTTNKDAWFALGPRIIWNGSTAGTITGLYVKNNIFYNTSGQSLDVLAAQNYPTKVSDIQVQYNCLYNNINNGTTMSGITYSNNITSNPQIRTTGNRWDTYYQLNSNSPCIDAGVNVGLPFLNAAPDLGRWEYSGSAPDLTAPSAVNNLAAGSPTSTSIILTWTSTGDDGTIGTASSYDIRYATYSITGSNWSNALQCTGEPTPRAANNSETFTVNGLSPDATYYFSIKVGDEVINWSVVSNSPSGKTQSASAATAEWKFDENTGTTANDTSGNGNNGTLTNSPVWVATGKVGGALEFDGTNKYVSVNDSNSLDITTALSIEAWVKSDVISTDGGPTRRIVDKGVYALGASNQSYFRVTLAGTGRGVGNTWSSSDAGVWHHIAGTYDASGGTNNLKLYQDGIVVAQATYTGNIDTNTSILNIGRQGSNTGRFDGIIDEVRVYNRVLTANEVLQHYTDGNQQQDTTAPATINTLQTSNLTTTSITLTWTAVGDDGTSGTAASYDIRYSNTQITSANFSSALQCSGIPTPLAAGTQQTLTVNSLTDDTTYYFAMKASDEVPNTSSISNIVIGKTAAIPPQPDTTAPATINNLTVTNKSSNTVTLQWASVGDDGTTGTATSYDIRYATYNITTGNFTNATTCIGEPTPQASGGSETFTITALSANTTYYIAMKVADEIPNTSGISNIASVKTSAVGGPIYYIDTSGSDTTGTGSISSPWKTISYAVSHVPVNQGCTVHLNAGTFNETEQSVVPNGINIEGSGMTNTIINSSYAGILLSLQSSSLSSGNGNQVISNLAIRGNNIVKEAIRVSKRHNVVMRELDIRDIAENGIILYGDDTTGYSNNLNIYNSSFSNISTNLPGGWLKQDQGAIRIHRLDGGEIKNVVINNTSTNQGGGIKFYLPNNPSVKNLKIHDCNIVSQWLDIELWSMSDGIEIYNNKFYGWLSLLGYDKGAKSYGLYVHDNTFLYSSNQWQKYCIELSIDDAIIENNYFENYPERGVVMWNNTGHNNIRINNNIFYNIKMDSILVGVPVGGMNNLNIYNNMFHCNNGSVAPAVRIDFVSGNTLSNVNIKNNIFIGDNSGSSIINRTGTGTLTNGVFSNNLTYQINNTNLTDFTQNGNLTNTNPQIRATGNRWDIYYQLNSNSPCIDRGIVIPGITDGYVGSAPDIGRYEYTTPDTTAPTAIGNLTTSNPTTTSVTLNWTASGDDGTTGTATTYDIRYQTYTISTANFTNAIQINGEPTPQVYGTNESYTVTGLNSDTTYYFAIKVGDEVPNWSGTSNITSGKTQAVVVADTTEPGTINTLNATNATTTNITLNWTAVGDDGTTGTGSIYDVRYTSNTQLSSSNWGSAVLCIGEPSPNANGSAETYIINGLTADTTYYIGIKVGDEVINWSGLSNIITVKTSGLPQGASAVGEWHFDEGSGSVASDTSGNNNAGTLYNNPQWVAGRVGSNALQYDGLNTYVSINSDSSLDTTTGLTLEAWVKSDVNSTDGGPTRRVIEKGVYTLAASNQAYFKILINGISSSVIKAWTASDVNVWRHLVGTYDSIGGTNNLKLYQDGILVAQTTATGSIDTNTTNLIIGRQGSTSGRFSGAIDEVRIYDRALTQQEVTQHYQGSIPSGDITSPNSINNLTTSNPTTTSVTLQWTATGDDGNTGTVTTYDIRYQTYTITSANWGNVTQATGEPTPKAAGSNEVYTVNNLNSNTTYYFAIKAADEVLNWTILSNVSSVKTQQATGDISVPSTINTLTASNPTYTSITLQWTAVGDDGTSGTATTYDIRYMENIAITGSNFNNAIQCSNILTPQVSGNSEEYTVNNLTIGTTYYFAIKVGDEIPNWSNISNVVTEKTLGIPQDTTAPNAIANLAVSTTSINTITITWTAPGDDNTTGTASEYDIRYYASIISSSNWDNATQINEGISPQESGNSETSMIIGLTSNTTYYIGIKARDEANNWSGISNVVSGKTQQVQGSGTTPNTVSYLTASPQNNNSIQLTWLESTSSNISSYRIYIATGNNAMDYTTPSYEVTSTETQKTITGLTANQEYKFVVRAVDTDGNEDTNTNIMTETAVTVINSEEPKIELTTPLNGMKINGDQITLITDKVLSIGIQEIAFEYKKATDTTWTAIEGTQQIAEGNTITGYNRWDTRALETDIQYNIRTVTTYSSGDEVRTGYITITKSSDSDIDIEETSDYKYERIDNRKTNTVKMLEPGTDLLCYVKISTGVLTNGTTDKVKITINPRTAPKVGNNLILIGNIHEIKMESGQTQFEQDIEISLPYKDLDNDNRIPARQSLSGGDDKDDILVTKLIVCTYNITTKKWEKVTTTTIDKTNKQLTTKTKHLSYYGIFAVLQSDLNTAHIYPNPYKPTLGHIRITFANLTTHTKIKIFNTAGELIYEDEKDTPTGELSWNVKNNKTEPIASGVYIYMITNNNGQTKKGKLAIIR